MLTLIFNINNDNMVDSVVITVENVSLRQWSSDALRSITESDWACDWTTCKVEVSVEGRVQLAVG